MESVGTRAGGRAYLADWVYILKKPCGFVLQVDENGGILHVRFFESYVYPLTEG